VGEEQKDTESKKRSGVIAISTTIYIYRLRYYSSLCRYFDSSRDSDFK